MSSTELDTSFPQSSEQIRAHEFVMVRRGYDPDEVRAYLEGLAEQFLVSEDRARRFELTAGASEASGEDHYQRLIQRFSDLIEMADQESERIVEAARGEAADVVARAGGEADRIRTDAQAHAEEVRQRADDLMERAAEEVERAREGIASERRVVTDQIDELRLRLLALTTELEGALGGPHADDALDADGPEIDADANPVDLSFVAQSVEVVSLPPLDVEFDEEEA